MAFRPDPDLYSDWKSWARAVGDYLDQQEVEIEERYIKTGDRFHRYTYELSSVSAGTYGIAISRRPLRLTSLQCVLGAGTCEIAIHIGSSPIIPTWNIGIPAAKTNIGVTASEQIAIAETLRDIAAATKILIDISNVSGASDLIVTLEGEAITWNQ